MFPKNSVVVAEMVWQRRGVTKGTYAEEFCGDSRGGRLLKSCQVPTKRVGETCQRSQTALARKEMHIQVSSAQVVKCHRPPLKPPLSFRYDKLIIDDQVYIYNDSEKRIERLPFSVYSMAATGSISPEHTRGGGVGGSQINGKINGHQAIRGAAGAVSNAGLMAAGIPRRLTYSFFSMSGH